MRKEFEIHGCIEVPPEMTEEEFWNRFIRFVEENGWSFGGGISEIRDGWHILPDGSRGCLKRLWGVHGSPSRELHCGRAAAGVRLCGSWL